MGFGIDLSNWPTQLLNVDFQETVEEAFTDIAPKILVELQAVTPRRTGKLAAQTFFTILKTESSVGAGDTWQIVYQSDAESDSPWSPNTEYAGFVVYGTDDGGGFTHIQNAQALYWPEDPWNPSPPADMFWSPQVRRRGAEAQPYPDLVTIADFLPTITDYLTQNLIE